MNRPPSVTTRLCGAGLAFTGFAMSLFIGLYVDNPFTTVVLRALAVMALFYVLGIFLASLGHKAIQENFNQEVERQKQMAQESSDLAAGPKSPNPDDKTGNEDIIELHESEQKPAETASVP